MEWHSDYEDETSDYDLKWNNRYESKVASDEITDRMLEVAPDHTPEPIERGGWLQPYQDQAIQNAIYKRICPNCGSKRLTKRGEDVYTCPECPWEYLNA